VIIKPHIFLPILLLFFTSLMGQNTVGVLVNQPGSQLGYTLFSPKKSNETFLIDNQGRLVNQWSSSHLPSLTAYLLEDGSLLRASALVSDTSEGNGGFEKFTWDGELTWEFYSGHQHHDIAPLPNGNVLMVVNDIIPVEEALANGRDPERIDGTSVRSLSILEIQQTETYSGEIVWAWHARDHLVQNYDINKTNYGEVSAHPELIDFNYYSRDGRSDWLHTNSIAYHPEFDQIVVSNRTTCDLWIIDHSTTSLEAASHTGGNRNKGGDLLYRWGNPQSYRAGTSDDQTFFAQHDAYWIAPGLPGAGHLMIFNNGLDRPEGNYPSLDEFIPPVDSLGNYSYTTGSPFAPQASIWSYFSNHDSSQFIAPNFGGSQRLQNGNTLICSPHNGRLFEVTHDGEIVWVYVNPVTASGILEQGSEPVQNEVIRCYRYTADYPGLIDKDLTPGAPIEIYSLAIPEDVQRLSGFYLGENYPNPFNPQTSFEYSLAEGSAVQLRIYDMLGRNMATLVDQYQTAGIYLIHWDSRESSGRPAASGLYYCKLSAGKNSAIQKMVLMR